MSAVPFALQCLALPLQGDGVIKIFDDGRQFFQSAFHAYQKVPAQRHGKTIICNPLSNLT